MVIIAVLMIVLQILDVVQVSGCPPQCVCSLPTTLRCDDASFSVIPTDVPINVEVLTLGGNNLTSIPDGSFSAFNQLEFLALNGNELSDISNETFRGLNSLVWLILTDNEIVDTSTAMFSTLPSLTRLYLNRNKIAEFADNVFEGLAHLTSLKLDSNNIAVLGGNTFLDLPALEILDLTFNRITTIDDDAFQGLYELDELWLSNNALTQISVNVFRPLRRLRRLYLKNNLLTTIPSFVEPLLPKLIVLNLFGNNIESLPGNAISGLHRLETLDLAFNNIEILNEEFFNADLDIKYLDLTSNDLKTLPPFNSSVVSSFFDNQMISIDLNSNPIQRIGPHAFYGLNGKTLDEFKVDLSSTQLEYIDVAAFEGITTVRYTLGLEDNRLQRLDSQTFAVFDIDSYNSVSVLMNTLRLYDNPWSCDCHLRDFREWLRENGTTVQRPLDLKCHSPDVYTGTSVLNIDADDMVCNAPLFDEPTKRISTDVGEPVHLDCNVTASPKATVYWVTPQGKEITGISINSTEYNLLSEEGLLIVSPSKIDQGNYACVATNENGVSIALRYLDVTLVDPTRKSPSFTESFYGTCSENTRAGQATLVGVFFGGLLVGLALFVSAFVICKYVHNKRSEKKQKMREESRMELEALKGNNMNMMNDE